MNPAELTGGDAVDEQDALFTVEETTEIIKVGRTTVYALVKSGELESVKIGRLRRIPKAAISRYISKLLADTRVAA